MKLLVGWGLSGPSYTPREERGARLGEPVWGRAELLRDLELRLGLGAENTPASERIPRYQARIAKLADSAAFYARSFSVDPLGTARTLLAWRDTLVEAGWDGSPVPNGGDRLDALAKLKSCNGTPLPASVADRLAQVQQALERRGLLAVTYTKKAHAELAGRIRQKLVAAGAYDEAMRLPLAYVGTVHAACLRLLQEFALDAGLSPNVDVVAGDDAQLLRQALESALESTKRQRLDELARGFQLRFEPRSKRFDWLTPVSDIMDLARSNRISPAALAPMAQRSIEGLLRLFKTPAADAAALDANLLREMVTALQTLNDCDDGTGVTRTAIATLKECLGRAHDQELTWVDWAKLSLLTPSQACADSVTKLREAAVAYERHPRLHAELSELVFAMFDAARVGLSAYQHGSRSAA